MPAMLSTRHPDFEPSFTALLGQKREDSSDVDAVVAAIIADVRTRGDAAVIEMTARFDRLDLTPETLAFSPAEIDAQIALVSAEDRAALVLAAQRIWDYHARQMPEDAMWEDASGAHLGWRWTPVSAAGLYVPGGLASYPSSVLMNAIPARVAGVGRLVVTCPTPGGVVNPRVLLAAQIRCCALAARRRSRRWPMARKPSPRLTRSPGREMPMSPPPSAGFLAGSGST